MTDVYKPKASELSGSSVSKRPFPLDIGMNAFLQPIRSQVKLYSFRKIFSSLNRVDLHTNTI